jgi:CTP synthase
VKGSIYEIPYMFSGQGFDVLTLEHFGMKVNPLKIGKWDKFVKHLRHPKRKVTIAVVGKYIALQDSYRSIYEALTHGAVANEAELEIIRIDSEDLETVKKGQIESMLKNADGILVPGGFGIRGIEGKIAAISFARTRNIPFFGICLGLHCAVIEFGRNVCGLGNANSTEINPQTPHPVISLLEEQELVAEKGGTMRLGAYPCKLTEGTKVRKIYGKELILERHRHRFEFTLKYKDLYREEGMMFGGIYPQSNLVETIELPNHSWYVATQFHPEFKSKPTSPHPLFRDFIRASIENRK